MAVLELAFWLTQKVELNNNKLAQIALFPFDLFDYEYFNLNAIRVFKFELRITLYQSC